MGAGRFVGYGHLLVPQTCMTVPPSSRVSPLHAVAGQPVTMLGTTRVSAGHQRSGRGAQASPRRCVFRRKRRAMARIQVRLPPPAAGTRDAGAGVSCLIAIVAIDVLQLSRKAEPVHCLECSGIRPLRVAGCATNSGARRRPPRPTVAFGCVSSPSNQRCRTRWGVSGYHPLETSPARTSAASLPRTLLSYTP